MVCDKTFPLWFCLLSLGRRSPEVSPRELEHLVLWSVSMETCRVSNRPARGAHGAQPDAGLSATAPAAPVLHLPFISWQQFGWKWGTCGIFPYSHIRPLSYFHSLKLSRSFVFCFVCSLSPRSFSFHLPFLSFYFSPDSFSIFISASCF